MQFMQCTSDWYKELNMSNELLKSCHFQLHKNKGSCSYKNREDPYVVDSKSLGAGYDVAQITSRPFGPDVVRPLECINLRRILWETIRKFKQN